jgi:hypothetical protein
VQASLAACQQLLPPTLELVRRSKERPRCRRACRAVTRHWTRLAALPPRARSHSQSPPGASSLHARTSLFLGQPRAPTGPGLPAPPLSVSFPRLSTSSLSCSIYRGSRSATCSGTRVDAAGIYLRTCQAVKRADGRIREAAIVYRECAGTEPSASGGRAEEELTRSSAEKSKNRNLTG